MSTLHIFLADPILAQAPPLPAFHAESMRFVYRLDIAHEGTDAELLEKAFRIFNIEHPADYRQRSLSIGDVVTINCRRSYRCDWIGWEQLQRPLISLHRETVPSDPCLIWPAPIQTNETVEGNGNHENDSCRAQ